MKPYLPLAGDDDHGSVISFAFDILLDDGLEMRKSLKIETGRSIIVFHYAPLSRTTVRRSVAVGRG